MKRLKTKQLVQKKMRIQVENTRLENLEATQPRFFVHADLRDLKKMTTSDFFIVTAVARLVLASKRVIILFCKYEIS